MPDMADIDIEELRAALTSALFLDELVRRFESDEPVFTLSGIPFRRIGRDADEPSVFNLAEVEPRSRTR
jgi:hypothetical protein